MPRIDAPAFTASCSTRAQVVRPRREAGYLDEGAWQVDFQLKDGVTLEFWRSELRSLWQHAHRSHRVVVNVL